MTKYILFLALIIGLLSCQERKNPIVDKFDSLEYGDTIKHFTEIRSVNNDKINTLYSVSDSLGIGVLLLQSKLILYNDSLLTDVFLSTNFETKEDESLNLASIINLPEYAIMHFACLEIAPKCYKVLVKNSGFKYIAQNNNCTFSTWQDYIMESFGVRRVNDKSNFVRQNPNNSSLKIDIPKGFELFCPMEMQEDWIKVQYDCFYNDKNNINEGIPCHEYIEKCSDPITGWIKWRDSNKLLIDIFIMP